MSNTISLRSIFNEAAQEYDAIRPGYPEALIADVLSLSAVPSGGRVLEIGCGTGQATLPFAQRGFKLLCLDIGPDLIAVAAQKMQAYPNVRFQNIAFEKWPARLGRYDLVFSATAFHWIPREIGYRKAALVLKPGGALAVFSNEHPRPSDGFFIESQAIYRQVTPEMLDPADQLSTAAKIQATVEYINSTGLFAPLAARTYPWKRTYSTAEYLRLLNTYSGHRALPDDRRQALYDGIAGLIDRRYGGKIEKEYLAVLYLGKKSG